MYDMHPPGQAHTHTHTSVITHSQQLDVTSGNKEKEKDIEDVVYSEMMESRPRVAIIAKSC